MVTSTTTLMVSQYVVQPGDEISADGRTWFRMESRVTCGYMTVLLGANGARIDVSAGGVVYGKNLSNIR